MDNKQMEEMAKKIFGSEPVELSADELEEVTGGVITADGEAKLRWGLGLAKKQGMTMDDVIKLVPQYYNIFHSVYPETTKEEAIDYIRANWDGI